MAANDQTIIIKKIKKGGHGHHGGAWKVAYADFVTAMMAFFLLLWLLSATSSAQKQGVAEYFTPTMGLKDSMGIGFNGGLSAAPEGNSRSDKTAPGLVVGQVKQGPDANAPNQSVGKEDPNAEDASKTTPSKPEENKADSEIFQEVTDEVKQAMQDVELKEFENNIIVQETAEGLKIDMIDDPQQPMFVPGSANLTDMGKKVLDSMSRVVSKTPNNISINGHTDSASATINPDYTIWELSTDRANAARRFLSTTVLEKERVAKVLGFADRELLVPQEPSSPRNRRITILVLRESYFRDPKEVSTTKGILTVPVPKPKKTEEKKPDAPEAEPEKSILDE